MNGENYLQSVRLMVVWKAISTACEDELFKSDSFDGLFWSLPQRSRLPAADVWVWYSRRAADMEQAVRAAYREVLDRTGTQPGSDGFDRVLQRFPELQEMESCLLALHSGGSSALNAAVWAQLKPDVDARYTPSPE